MANKKQFRKMEVYEDVHKQIGRLAWDNEVNMKVLVSELLCEILNDKEKCAGIIKKIKTTKT